MKKVDKKDFVYYIKDVYSLKKIHLNLTLLKETVVEFKILDEQYGCARILIWICSTTLKYSFASLFLFLT